MDSQELEIRLGEVTTEPNQKFRTDLGPELFQTLLDHYLDRGIVVEELEFWEYKDHSNRYRVTISGVMIESIKKRRKSVSNIAVPECQLDIRIGLSREKKIFKDKMHPRGRKILKKRHVFVLDPFIVQFTEVHISKETVSYQVELELLNQALKEGLVSMIANEMQVELEKMLEVTCGKPHLLDFTQIAP